MHNKLLRDFCEQNNLLLVKINYTGMVGWDICKPDGSILVSFEPCYYTNGDKWFIRHSHEGFKGSRYLQRITKSYLNLYVKPDAISYYKNSSIANSLAA